MAQERFRVLPYTALVLAPIHEEPCRRREKHRYTQSAVKKLRHALPMTHQWWQAGVPYAYHPPVLM